MRRLVAFALLLALAGCATPRGACGLAKVAELPLLASDGRPMIEVPIAGRPARLVIDTGLAGIALTDAAVARLGLRRDTTRRFRLAGIGGSSSALPARVTGLAIGTEALPDFDAAVLPAARAEPAGPGADGLLGTAVLHRFDIDLDMPRHRIAFYRGRPCPGVKLPMPGPATVLETAQTEPQRHLVLRLEIDGQPHLAMLDTGARRTLVSRQATTLSEAALAAGRPIILTGVGPGQVLARQHRFDSITIGFDSFARPSLVVLDDPGIEASVVLGTDYLALRRMFISYSTDRLYIQHPPPH